MNKGDSSKSTQFSFKIIVKEMIKNRVGFPMFGKEYKFSDFNNLAKSLIFCYKYIISIPSLVFGSVTSHCQVWHFWNLNSYAEINKQQWKFYASFRENLRILILEDVMLNKTISQL